MPIFFAGLATLFGGLASWLAAYVGKKAAITLAYATISLGLVAALWAALLAIVSAVAWPSLPGVQTGLWLANAGAFSGLVSVIVATELSISAYRYQRDSARIMATS